MTLLNKWNHSIKERQQQSIEYEASSRITIKVFNGEMFIAFDGFPLVLVPKDTKACDCTEKLNEIRKSFINYKNNGKEYKTTA